ncbi:oxidoreductase [Micromonospora yangpuensis]|nr:oxidoreductase [Micromonospora yangpuensis]
MTGASSGIGAATARALAAQGAVVVVTARRADRLEALAKEIGATGGEAWAYEADVTDQHRCETMVAEVVDRYGHLDVLVNNAGLLLLGPIEHAPIYEWRQMVEVNLFAGWRLTHLALPHLLAAAEHGSRQVADVVFVGSVGRYLAGPVSGVYDATKSAVASFAESLRKQVARRHVRVAVVEPGFVAPTELPTQSRPEILSALSGNFDPGTPITPEDAASAVVFAVGQPRHAAVSNLVLRPTEQLD